MIRCDDRPPLLEEPFAQTLSGKRKAGLLITGSIAPKPAQSFFKACESENDLFF